MLLNRTRGPLRTQGCYSFSVATRIVTGIQPTGQLTIGNYLGSVQNAISLQTKYPAAESFLFIANLHSLTTAFDEVDHGNLKYNTSIGRNSIEIAKTMIASGVRVEDRNVLFMQSHVKQHAELCWLLGCLGPQHWLNNMVQFKEKTKKLNQNVSSLGIYSYPVLMAADILLYKANFVPVGEDQQQHLFLTKKYAQRFNTIMGRQVLPVPECILTSTRKVMSLVDPAKKMSKSDANDKSRINMDDSKDKIAEKIRRATTDAQGSSVTYSPENRPGLSNLLTIYSSFRGVGVEKAVAEFEGKGIKDFKEALVEVISKRLAQIQGRVNSLSDAEVNAVLKQGADRARVVASQTITEVKQLLRIES